MTKNTEFIFDYEVGDKTFRLDALLILAELAINNNHENPTTEHMIAAVKNAVRPIEQARTLTDTEAYALSLRVTMSLKAMGNVFAS